MRVRTEDIGNTKTGDMGNTISWADDLEIRVTDGRKTEICEFGAERSLYGERAVQGVWDQPQKRAQVAWAICERRDGGTGGAESSPQAGE